MVPIRFLASGALLTGLHFVFQALLVKGGRLSPLLSHWIAFHAAVPVGLLLHSRFTFAGGDRRPRVFLRYYLNGLVMQGINFAIYATLIALFPSAPLVTWGLATATTQVINYFRLKGIFQTNRGKPAEAQAPSKRIIPWLNADFYQLALYICAAITPVLLLNFLCSYAPRCGFASGINQTTEIGAFQAAYTLSKKMDGPLELQVTVDDSLSAIHLDGHPMNLAHLDADSLRDYLRTHKVTRDTTKGSHLVVIEYENTSGSGGVTLRAVDGMLRIASCSMALLALAIAAWLWFRSAPRAAGYACACSAGAAATLISDNQAAVLGLWIILAAALFWLSRQREAGGTLLLMTGSLVSAMLLRLSLFDHESKDFTFYLAPWVRHYAEHPGLSGLRTAIGDYTLPYNYYLALLVKLGIKPLTGIKLLGALFDLILAICAYRLLSPVNRAGARLAFVGVLLCPTVLLNSSYWGQSDAIYSACLILALHAALRHRANTALSAFGLALAVKLQAVFFAPFLAVILMARRMEWWRWVIVPGVISATWVPALLLGRSLQDCIKPYVTQLGSYPQLTQNAPSVWMLLPWAAFKEFGTAAILCASAALMGLWAYAYRVRHRWSFESLLLLGYMTVLIGPWLLPRMHERYFFPADVLSVILFCHRPRFWYYPLITVSASYVTYAQFLGLKTPDSTVWAAWALGGLILKSCHDLAGHLYPDDRITPTTRFA